MVAAKNKDAFVQFQKSYFLYPSEKIKYLLQNSLVLSLSNATYMDEQDWKTYIYISRFKSDIITNEALNDEFLRITNKLLIDKGNLDLYTRAFHYIYERLSDSSLKASIEFNYYYSTARYYLMSAQLYKAFPYIESAFKLRPDNIEVQNIFVSCLYSRQNNADYDTSFFSDLENYYATYERLRNDSRVVGILASYYITQARAYYDSDEWKEGDVYLSKFESLMDQSDEDYDYYDMAEELYTQAAAHFYKLNNKKKAREYINRGIKYYPDSYRLKSSLQMLK
jgi:tetratricopeptide (TPR) repeat protein